MSEVDRRQMIVGIGGMLAKLTMAEREAVFDAEREERQHLLDEQRKAFNAQKQKLDDMMCFFAPRPE